MYNYSMGIESYVNRIGGNSNVAEERFESLNIVNCNGSLAYGDIGFGDGELNQGIVATSTILNRSNSLSSL